MLLVSAASAVVIGALCGLLAFVIGVGLVGNAALLLALAGPPIAVRLLTPLRGGPLIAIGALGAVIALLVAFVAAGGYSS